MCVYHHIIQVKRRGPSLPPSLARPPVCSLRLELCFRCAPGFSWDSDPVTFEKGTSNGYDSHQTSDSLLERMFEKERYNERRKGANEIHRGYTHRGENRQVVCF